MGLNRFYVGIDPGVDGAIAVFHESGLFHSVYDLPTHHEGKKRSINGDELYGILLRFKILMAYIEDVHSTPQMGVKSSFNFGESLGIIKGVLAGSEIEYGLISPQRWKKHFSFIGKDKDYPRTKAIKIVNGAGKHLKRKKDQDRADAMWICVCGMGRLNTCVKDP